MKPNTLLRIAALLLFLQATAHTLFGVFFYHSSSPAESSAVQAMQSAHFSFRGNRRSFWDFQIGYGLIVATFSYMNAVLVWQSSQTSTAEAGMKRGTLIVIFAALLGYALCSWAYFFYGPAILLGVAALFIGAALFQSARLPSQ